MDHQASAKGLIPFTVPSYKKQCSTYYKVFGNLKSGTTPLVCLHGGPGAGREHMEEFAGLTVRYGIPVVLYDQIGCGSSSHVKEVAGDVSFWNEDIFIAELNNLLDHLDLRDGPGLNLLGHSWGGVIGSAFASNRPRGLQKLVIMNSSAIQELTTKSWYATRDSLPAVHRAAILEAQQSGDFNSTAYQDAYSVIFQTRMCRTESPPPSLAIAGKNLDEAEAMSQAMYGTGVPWSNTGGSMCNWTCVSRLHLINVPTLICNSEFDTSAWDFAQQPFLDHIPDVRWHKFAGAGHIPWLEGEATLDAIIKVLVSVLHVMDTLS
ncbi:hypothetical protein ANO11243_071470 [Dothideomycetidae sp. 11243]|nr:hypothetical protein ANO11243_071470 [fungal sp. No.11243]